jgi:amino acid permease
MKALSDTFAPKNNGTLRTKPQIKTGKQVSNFKSIYFTLVTTTLGLSALYMPKLLLETGVVLGLFVLGFSGLLSYITCSFLCQAARKMGATSYPMLTKLLLGKYSFMVDIFYILNLFGIIISNQTFVSKTLSGCVARIFFGPISHDSITFTYISVATIFLSNLAILPYITSRNLTKLKKLSQFTIVGFSFALATIMATYLVPDFFGFSIAPFDLSKLQWANFAGLKTTSGMYLLSMAVHLVIIDIDTELRPGSDQQSFLLVLFNKITCLIIYASISIYGFLAIYQAPKLDSLNNYFLFFLSHQNLNHYVLRTAHVMITLSIMFSSIFAYIPLIKFFNSLIDDTAFDVFENEGSVYEVNPFPFNQRLPPRNKEV